MSVDIKSIIKKAMSVFLAILLCITVVPMFSITASAEETTVDKKQIYFSGNYGYSINTDGTATIEKYSGGDVASVPSELDGHKVTVIESKAFSSGIEGFGEYHESITIPDSVIEIKPGIGEYFREIIVDDNNQYFCDVDGVLFSKDMTVLYSCPQGKYPDSSELNMYQIPYGVTNIEEEAFIFCLYLDEIVIPDSVKSIGNRAFSHCDDLTDMTIPKSVTSIGYDLFDWCQNIQHINVDENNENYCDVNGVLFNKDKTMLHTYPSKKTETEYQVPSGVKSINDWAFHDCDSLKKITITNGVTNIGNSAFNGCGRLTEIMIPSSVSSIGDSAFRSCNFTDITIPNSVTSIGYDAFGDCNLLNINVDENNKNYCDVDGVLFNKDKTMLHTYPSQKTETEYQVLSGVKSINDWAFSYCDSLKKVTIPNSVTNIGDTAFGSCSALTDIAIPNSVTSIGDRAFAYCDSLKKVNIPNSLTSIGEGTFCGCRTLTDIIIPNSVKSIGDNAFSFCSLKEVTIPDSVTVIGDRAFEWCGNLTEITIPNSVKSIGVGAFEWCSNIKDVYFMGKKSEWNRIEIGWDNSKLVNSNIHFAIEEDKHDINEDGQITATDVRWILQATSSMRELSESQLKSADFNGDGKVTATDARMLLLSLAEE